MSEYLIVFGFCALIIAALVVVIVLIDKVRTKEIARFHDDRAKTHEKWVKKMNEKLNSKFPSKGDSDE